MSVYVFMEARIKDSHKFGQYLASLSEIVVNFKGRWLAYDSAVTPLQVGIKEERRQPQRVFLLEFPSMAQVRRCFACPEHQCITFLNNEGADMRAILVHGIGPGDIL